MSIKKGDNVIIRTGKDRGKQGKVLRLVKDENKVIVEGINVYKKNERPRQQGAKGQIVERPMPVHSSNVSLYCSKCKKGVRVATELDKNGKKSRICAKCKAKI